MRPVTFQFIMSALLLATTQTAEAGLLSQLLRKGADMVTHGTTRAGRETVESGVKTAASKGLKAGARTASHAATVPAQQAGRRLILNGGKVATTATARSVVLDRLGIEGAKAMQRLTPTAAKRMAEASSQLAKSPHKAQWLSIIQRYGDAGANFVWKHRAAVAVTASSTAVLIAPADFFKASGQLLEATAKVTGESIIRPIVTETTRNIAAPIAEQFAKHAAASVPWKIIWGLLGLASITAAVYWFCRYRILR